MGPLRHLGHDMSRPLTYAHRFTHSSSRGRRPGELKTQTRTESELCIIWATTPWTLSILYARGVVLADTLSLGSEQLLGKMPW
jgi:hypothetical protein